MGRSSYAGFPEVRASSWRRACSRTRSNAATLPRCGLRGSGSGTFASAASVVTPQFASSFRCAFRIPATSETWSSCVHRFSHTEYQLQISQCATGSGYGTAASTDADRGFAISASKFRRTSRKYARNSSKR